MNVTTTVKIKLDLTAKTDALLRATQVAYIRALNLTSAVAFTNKVSNAIALHHLTYRDTRAATSLSANLVCSARAIVAEAYKRELNKLHKWRDGAAMRYDARTCTLKLEHARATLTTIEGRVTVSLVLANYQRQYLNADWRIAATVTLCRQGRVWYLHLVAEKQVPDASGSNVLGVDSGINRIAFTSSGKSFAGGTIKQVRRRRFRQRRSLQTKPEGQSKSRNQRRTLKRLSGKEHRAVEWKLWNIANGIVKEAVYENCATIAVENLKHIRSRIRVAKKQRLIQYGWPFSSLFVKLNHVASKHGITVAEVDAAYTSRTCSRCGHCDKANRKTQSAFKCVLCGYSHNADWNAAFNIRARYVARELAVRKPALTSVKTLQGGDRAKAA